MCYLHILLLFMVTINCQRMSTTCEISEGDRQLILAKVKTQILEALGPPPTLTTSASPTPSPGPPEPMHAEQRTIHKRHSKSQRYNAEDTSKVILFPSSDIACESPNLDVPLEEPGNSFTYIFRPSTHVLSRKVLSAQLWFFTGKNLNGQPTMTSSMTDKEPTEVSVPISTPTIQSLGSDHASSNEFVSDPFSTQVNASSNDDNDSLQNFIDLQVLSEHDPVTLVTYQIQRVDDWTVFHLAPAFLRYVTRGIFVLLVRCPSCPCSNQPENTPFLMFNTQPTHRMRRSGVPWSPSALDLLQRPPSSGSGSTECHRGSLNITFEELGWDQWIVHPGSFQFNYCHGTCSPSHGLSPALHWGHCCAALPSTMKSLRVTTTTDGGFSYRYETVPNLLTQNCACS
ncbi:inhibin alpha chain [Bombina bombina]|uniref:inhibin alpha chain n=1 Tax=Bombina bombina TaxID=8345 RepID=UPI00235B27E4|nr:inhibin alpha chain [Bombina bombina]